MQINPHQTSNHVPSLSHLNFHLSNCINPTQDPCERLHQLENRQSKILTDVKKYVSVQPHTLQLSNLVSLEQIKQFSLIISLEHLLLSKEESASKNTIKNTNIGTKLVEIKGQGHARKQIYHARGEGGHRERGQGKI